MRFAPVCLLVLLSPCTLAQQAAIPPLTAEIIMARVAANQDHSQAERTHYVYEQHARVLSRKGKTNMCEEVTDTRVTPTANGASQTILKLDGKLLIKHDYITYTQLPKKSATDGKDDDSHIDRDLVEDMRDHLTGDDSKDGISAGLFPLTTKTQAEYNFHLVGREQRDGREVFHLAFAPKDKDDIAWKGDAYIDATDFQPVLVQTAMSRKMPFAVRTLLGTSLPGLGFVVTYAPQPDGIWFPVTFGTEFKINVLFFFHRSIVISARNHDFEKTHVTSRLIDPAMQ